jgi:hypothetical protein
MTVHCIVGERSSGLRCSTIFIVGDEQAEHARAPRLTAGGTVMDPGPARLLASYPQPVVEI